MLCRNRNKKGGEGLGKVLTHTYRHTQTRMETEQAECGSACKNVCLRLYSAVGSVCVCADLTGPVGLN